MGETHSRMMTDCSVLGQYTGEKGIAQEFISSHSRFWGIYLPSIYERAYIDYVLEPLPGGVIRDTGGAQDSMRVAPLGSDYSDQLPVFTNGTTFKLSFNLSR